jgi:hypothetical protein
VPNTANRVTSAEKDALPSIPDDHGKEALQPAQDVLSDVTIAVQDQRRVTCHSRNIVRKTVTQVFTIMKEAVKDDLTVSVVNTYEC